MPRTLYQSIVRTLRKAIRPSQGSADVIVVCIVYSDDIKESCCVTNAPDLEIVRAFIDAYSERLSSDKLVNVVRDSSKGVDS